MVKSIKFHGALRRGRSFTAGFTVALITLGCQAGEKPSNVNANSEKDDLREFTTQGKPTKTIETPWGLREVYDPAADPDLIAAYKDVKDLKLEYPHYIYKYDDVKIIGYSNPKIDLLFRARKIHHQDIMRLGCIRLRSYDCGVTDIGDLNRKSTCDPLDNLGKPPQTCESEIQGWAHNKGTACTLNDKKSYDISGQLAEEPYAKIKEPATFSNFFAFHCSDWKEPMPGKQFSPKD